MEDKIINVRCLLRDQRAHVTPVMEAMVDSARFIWDEEWDPKSINPENTDILVGVNEFQYEIARCVEASRTQGIPSLILQDGVLEWRCQYRNPKFAYGGGPAQHQPVLSDKIACIGAASARHIGGWGNASKVEVTGMPRMDALVSSRGGGRGSNENKRRVAVLTAKKPWFIEEEKEVVLTALRDVKEVLEGISGVDVVWRITKGLESALDVSNKLHELSSGELVDFLKNVDAVITTPSTAMLEAMLLNLPVALLDYHCNPCFTQASWIISSREQINPVISEILEPPATKMLFQDACLMDALFFCENSTASARVGELISKLVAIGREARGRRLKPCYPEDLLRTGFVFCGTNEPVLSALYPDHPAFMSTDLKHLQAHLSRVLKDNEVLSLKLEQRGIGYWLGKAAHLISRKTNLTKNK